VTDTGRRILFVHAHPDDESLTCGGTMARYAAEGAAVTLVTCTLGEEGEILVPRVAGLAAAEADQLGGYRIGELDRACEAVGVRDHRFLGGAGRYRDSGMIGTPSNSVPRAFWNADFDQAVALLREIVEDVCPQVVVTYDPHGGYGHPDHIQTHRVTTAAVEASRWQAAKVYWVSTPRSVALDAIAAVESATTPFTTPTLDQFGVIVDDGEITAEIDATPYVAAKRAALIAHATQVTVDGDFYALSNNFGRPLSAVEHFLLARGRRGPTTGPTGREDDLFAGLE
jgi:N-acetyl-1-D-myo-inositol-2-amino-2-deoxy-alpha-D-glucopyranoside deacetylase